MEIERKYLVDLEKLGSLDAYPVKVIEQGYLNEHPVVRIRREDDEYILTYKGKGLMVREEYNLPLDKDSYEHMKTKCDGVLIAKRRHLIPYGKYTIELDIFEGDLKGLNMAEVEFPSESEADSFVPPAWFVKEVTMDKNYHNSNMIHGFKGQRL